MQDDTLQEIFRRLNETEAQRREQSVKIDNLAEKTTEYIDLLKTSMANSERREANFWKVITVLVGAIITLILGKGVATDLIRGVSTGTPLAFEACPINILPHNDKRVV